MPELNTVDIVVLVLVALLLAASVRIIIGFFKPPKNIGRKETDD